MERRCGICGKGPVSGNTVARRGSPKRKGGAGRKITGITKRTFKPNLQRIKSCGGRIAEKDKSLHPMHTLRQNNQSGVTL